MTADTGDAPAALASQSPDRAALSLGVALTCAVAVWLLAPSVAWFDAGELGAAAVQLGVPHPTGFAGFCLGGHATSRVPLGSAALRVHLLGAAAAALAVAVWLRTGLASPPAFAGRVALLAAAALAPLAVPALALHVRATEVYAPVWLAAALTVAVGVCAPSARQPWLLAALWGAGAGLHIEAALLPGLGWLVSVAPLWRRPRLWAGSALLGVGVAATAVVYLPLAAQRQPLLNWGDPATLPALLDHLSAASIRQAFGARIGGGGQDVVALGRLLWTDAGVLLLPAALGVATSWRGGRRWLAWTLGLVVVDCAYSVLVNPMGLRDKQAGLVTLVALCVLAAVGMTTAARAVLSARSAESGAAVALSVLVAVALSGPAAARQDDLRAGARYADRLLSRAAPAATLVTASDHAGSACAWLQGAEGVRPDAACVPGVFLRQDRQTAQAAQAHQRPQWIRATGKDGIARLSTWVSPSAGPVAWQVGLSSEDAMVGAALLPGLPWSALAAQPVVAADARAAALALADAATAVCSDLAGDAACRRAPTLAAALSAELAVHAALWARRDAPVAETLARAALQLAETPKALHNLAALVVGRDPAFALAACERALALQPDYTRAHRVAARAALTLGLAEHGIAHAQAAAAALTDPSERARWVQGLLADAPAAVRPTLERALAQQSDF